MLQLFSRLSDYATDRSSKNIAEGFYWDITPRGKECFNSRMRRHGGTD